MRSLLVGMMLIGSCVHPTPPPAPPVPPKPTPVNATCADVCARAMVLGCESAEPTPNGAGCIDVCENTVEDGTLAWDLPCRSSAKTCDEADACERTAAGRKFSGHR